MYNVLNTFLEYTYFYTSENITSYAFLLVVKIAESLQCILEQRKLARKNLRVKIPRVNESENFKILKFP